MMQDSEEYSSWLESRRLIISQLTALDASIKDLAIRIDKYNETARDRAAEYSKEANVGISELRLRVTMLEMRAKLWSCGIGLVSGGLATGLINMFLSMVSAHK